LILSELVLTKIKLVDLMELNFSWVYQIWTSFVYYQLCYLLLLVFLLRFFS
jgi:hypothetical protein